MRLNFLALCLSLLFACVSCSTTSRSPVVSDQLPSWNAGANKTAIQQFVATVTDPGSPGFVPEAERVATFDNDGTLWSEQPLYFQLFFALAQIKAMAPNHPEWQTTEPFRSALAGDMRGVMASGEKGLMELLAASHSGMSSEVFATSARGWAATAIRSTRGRSSSPSSA